MPAEQPLWQGRPSLKALTIELIASGLYAITLSVSVYFAYGPAMHALAGVSRDVARTLAANAGGFQLAAILFVVTLAALRLGRLAWRGLLLRSQSYRLSDQRLLIESGVFSRTINEIDLRTVDDITFHQSFVERMLGLGEIGIVSSEPAAQPGASGRPGLRARLTAVADPRAVREQIRNAAYEATGRQVFMRPT
jgi:uncharacterized membrane protein YdbT with pleckstrin-like domain